MSARQRLLIFYDSNVSSVQALKIDDADIHFRTMHQHNCSFQNIANALSIAQMHERGFETVAHYRDIGMDTLDLLNVRWMRELVQLFGRDAVVSNFVKHGVDAVTMAGTESGISLGLEPNLLLELCLHQPKAAEEVLKTLKPLERALPTIPLETLLATGIQCDGLKRVGISITHLTDIMKATTVQLARLGVGQRTTHA